MDVLPFPTRGALALAPATVCPMCDRVVTPSNESITREDGVIVHTSCARVKPFIQPDGSRTETERPTPSLSLITTPIEPDDAGELLIALNEDAVEGGIMPGGRQFKLWFHPKDANGDRVGKPFMLVGDDYVTILRKYVQGQRRAIERAGRTAS